MQIEEARYFTVLLACGFRYDFIKWVEENAKKTDADDIVVILSEIYTDTDCVISELERFIGEQKPDEVLVCSLLRGFISDRYKNGKMNVNDAMEALKSFVQFVGMMYQAPWDAPSRLCDWYGMVVDGYKDYNAFLDAFHTYLEKGEVPDAFEIWNSPASEEKITFWDRLFSRHKKERGE